MSTDIDGTNTDTRRLTATEAVALCRFAKAACPQQQFDEFTPDMWGELLSDLRFQDCKDALVAVVKRQPFVSPSEIRAEAKKIRYNRLAEFGPFDPPPSVNTDAGYSKWLYAMNRRICDGELTREAYDREQAALGLKDRPMPALEGVFRRVGVTDHRNPAPTDPTTEATAPESETDHE